MKHRVAVLLADLPAGSKGAPKGNKFVVIFPPLLPTTSKKGLKYYTHFLTKVNVESTTRPHDMVKEHGLE